MTVPVQPAPNNHTKIVVMIIIGFAVFVLCLVAIVCLGPLGIMAWMVDRQADVSEQGPQFQLFA